MRYKGRTEFAKYKAPEKIARRRTRVPLSATVEVQSSDREMAREFGFSSAQLASGESS